MFLYAPTTVGMVLDALLVVVVLVCLFVCFVIACHCKITAYVGDNKLILIFILCLIGEIRTNSYEDIVFSLFTHFWFITCCDLDLWSHKIISTTNPNTSVAKIGWNSLHWFWDMAFTRFSGCTDAFTDAETRIQYASSTAFQRWRRHKNCRQTYTRTELLSIKLLASAAPTTMMTMFRT